MKTILVIFGTRPEAIKMAPVIRELKKYPEDFRTIICVTAQHRTMLDQVLVLFGIAPDYDLNIMQPCQDLYDVTANVLSGLKVVLKKTRPDLVLVHGDTTTTFAASLASFYCKIPVGHVEAGLRSGNLFAPWPEEMNRRLTGALATLHFAPTERSRQNLLKEGVTNDEIKVTGNTVIDALFMALGKIERENLSPLLENELVSQFPSLNQIFPRSLEFDGPQFILVTGHRRENFGDGFDRICHALKELANRKGLHIIYPVHLNPNVQEPVQRILGKSATIHLIEPLDYLPFVYLMNRAHLIITDSGGIQEEAPSLGKPVLVTREVTERPEAVEAGTVLLVGSETEIIVREAVRLFDDCKAYRDMSYAHNPYGDGLAAERIISFLRDKPSL